LVRLAWRWQGREGARFVETANVVKSSPTDMLGGFDPPIQNAWWVYVAWWILFLGILGLVVLAFWKVCSRQAAKRSGRTTKSDVAELSFRSAVKAATGVKIGRASCRETVES